MDENITLEQKRLHDETRIDTKSPEWKNWKQRQQDGLNFSQRHTTTIRTNFLFGGSVQDFRNKKSSELESRFFAAKCDIIGGRVLFLGCDVEQEGGEEFPTMNELDVWAETEFEVVWISLLGLVK